MTEVLRSFVNEVDADIYVLSHATAPFVRVESFELAVKKVQSDEFDSALSVSRLQEFLWTEGKPNYDLETFPEHKIYQSCIMKQADFMFFKRYNGET